MAVATNWGPPSLQSSIEGGVDSLLGSMKSYQTGQYLQNMPKDASGNIDFRKAAVDMLQHDPATAAQLIKIDEAKGLQSWRNRALDIQQQQVDIAKDKSTNIPAEGKIFHIGPTGQLKGTTDIETGVYTPAPAAGAAPETPATPKSVVGAGFGREPTEDDLKLLKSDPSKAPLFDEVYGVGSANRYLSGGGPSDPRDKPPAVPAPAAPAAPKPSTASDILRPPPGLTYTQRQEWMKNRIKEQSSVDNAELKKADDSIQSGLGSLQNLREIIKLNEKAFQGPGAELRGNLAALTGIGGKQAGVDTLVMQNKLTSGALEQLRSTFGGNPTEGERAILIKVQGSASQPTAVRKEIFDDALRLVARRVKFSQRYAAAVRAGQYMDPNFTDATPVD